MESYAAMFGDDLGELLGERIPSDHSRPVLADHYAARLRAHRVLDLGCGTGDSVDDSARPSLTSSGSAPTSRTRRRCPPAPTRSDAEFVTFDGRRLPFDDAAFELVFCKQVLEHVERPHEIVAEAARVLEPGGHFAGSTSMLEGFHSRSTFNWDPIRVHARGGGRRDFRCRSCAP